MTVCKFWLKGYCRFGDSCRFEHPRQNQGGAPQQQNRFDAPGNRNAPQNQNQNQNQNQQGRGQPFNQNRGGNRDELPFNLDREIIRADLTIERPNWILSCYGPGKGAPAQLFGGAQRELSFEEARIRFYELAPNGQQQTAINEFNQMQQNAEQQMQNALNNLDGAIRFILDGEKQHPNRIDICNEAGGAPSNSNPFASSSKAATPFGQPSTQASGPSFGQPSTQTSGTPFGQPSNLSSGNSFGQPSTMNAGPSFGKPSVAASPFARPAHQATSSQSNPFASAANNSGAKPANPFAAAAAASGATPNPFAKAGGFASSPAAENPFAKASTASGPSNPFAQPPPSGQASNPFARAGTGSGFGNPTPAANPFSRPQETQQPATMQSQAAGITNGTGQGGQKDMNGRLSSWNGRPVNYIDGEPCTRRRDGEWERIFFPDGAPQWRKEVERAPEPNNTPAEVYQYAQESGSFKDGVMPELPPERDLCSWAF